MRNSFALLKGAHGHGTISATRREDVMNKRRGRQLRTVCTAALLSVGIVALPGTVSAIEDDCVGAAVLYNNHKIDIPLWPDDHGHDGGAGPPSGDWEYVNSQASEDGLAHSEFDDSGYADEYHVICRP